MVIDLLNCNKAPFGWTCTRERGHEGPCAAKPTAPKLRFELIPVRPMQELALAITIGAEKHGDDDWLKEPKPISHHVGALCRHLYAFMAGEVRDQDGQHHLASVAARALMIIELLERNRG
jgi:Domain of unknown function (DUF5664)